MSRRLTEDESVWMYEDEDRENDEFTDADLQNGLAQLITGDWSYGSEIRWENIRVETYEQAGVMTYNEGLVLTLPDGTEYQLTIVQSR